jgi:hypothetical protein
MARRRHQPYDPYADGFFFAPRTPLPPRIAFLVSNKYEKMLEISKNKIF